MKKKKHRLLPALLIIIFGLFAVTLLPSFKKYETADAADFQKHGGILPSVMPEDAADCKFFMKKNPFARRYYAHWYTSDPDAYIAALISKYHLTSQDENDLRYGYAHWYLMPVSECRGESELDDFPVYLHFETVTERDIRDAVILVYEPQGSGSRSGATVYFPDTGEFVWFYSISM